MRDTLITSPAVRAKAPELPGAGAEIAGRYRLLEPLGRGGHGEVWSALDRVLGETVAFKWLHEPGTRWQAWARREIAVLRMLRMPGVVRLFDEDTSHGHVFVVMERLSGAPFPGRLRATSVPSSAGRADVAATREGRGRPWSDVEPAALSLLEVLARVHARGVVHRDLKPANVLVDAEGRATLVDFGIASWHEADPRSLDRGIAGTPAYMAPEQLAGAAADARADLYAVGVMMFEALTGALPFGDGEPVWGAGSEGAPSLAARVPDVPEAVRAALGRLLARSPEARFRTAEDVLAALVPLARAASRPLKKASSRHSERDLRRLFAGPDRIFHLREDAARHLFARTAGDPARVAAELEAWVRLGLARTTNEGLAVEPGGLVRLRYLGAPAGAAAPIALENSLAAAHEWLSLAVCPLSPRALAEVMETSLELARSACEALVQLGLARADGEGFAAVVRAEQTGTDAELRLRHRALADALERGEDGRLYHLVAGGAFSAAAAEAEVLGRALAERGDLGGARAALGEGLAAFRTHVSSRAKVEADLLCELTKVAFAEGTTIAFDLALYELSRARSKTPVVAALESLLRAAIHTPAAAAALSPEELFDLPSFEDPELQRRRNHVRVLAGSARLSPPEIAAALGETRAWAESTGHLFARLCLAEGTATLRYAEGDFESAAAAHEEAARLDPWITGRIAATTHAASALLEAFRTREARTRAAKARRLAAAHRHHHSEARAEWLLRSARYRAGESLRPDRELVRAVERLGAPSLLALVCLTEAAIAHRTGDRAVTAELASASHRAWSELNRRWGALLARSLAICSGAPTTPEETARLAESALVCPVPGIGIQALGLLASVDSRIGPRLAKPRSGPRGARGRQATSLLSALLAPIPPQHRGSRMDVLSADEAESALLSPPPGTSR